MMIRSFGIRAEAFFLIIMTTTQFGHVIPMIGAGCALLGFGMLIYYLFSDDGKY